MVYKHFGSFIHLILFLHFLMAKISRLVFLNQLSLTKFGLISYPANTGVSPRPSP